MINKRFEIIKGGLETPPHISKMQYVSGYVTDTRLMGVVGLYMHWIATDAETCAETDLHQFYYYESEEFGLDDYHSIRGDDLYAVSRIKVSLFGGLGGESIDISEKEACYLVQRFAEFNKENNLPLPGNLEEYSFILSKELVLTPKERNLILKKTFTTIETDYQAVHYFLMRVFGKDYSAARYLDKGTVFLGLYEDLPISTMCLNKINDLPAAKNQDVEEDKMLRKSYLTETLLDCGTFYCLAISEVIVDWDHKVTGFIKHSSMKISSAEASMLLRRSEYMTIYSMNISPLRFEKECANITDYALSSNHECGKLYMLLNDDNAHLKRRVFRLSDDVRGLCFVTHYGQVILAAYSIDAIHRLESELRSSNAASSFQVLAKYEFKEPLIYEFISSGFDDFNEYLEIVKDDDQDDE